jgi:glycosyltransferase involved in cell wall biosynthesis
MSSRKTILLFEPDASGHHSGYLYSLLINYLANDYCYDIVVLTSPDFFAKHPHIIEKTTTERTKWLCFSDEEVTLLAQQKSVLKRASTEWNLYNQYAKSLKAVYGLLMYVDYLQIAFLTKSPPFCATSGILFRPTLSNYFSASWKENINYWRKNLILKWLVNSKSLTTLFTLDPFAASLMNAQWKNKKVKYLPDPLTIYPVKSSVEAFKNQLKISADRKVFLIFGFLDDRKGISDMMETIGKLTKEQAQKGTLIIAGAWEKAEKKRFESQLKVLEGKTDFQIIDVNTFIQDEDIQLYFQASDYILALYQKHIGMSGIMVRAAAAGKPLLTYNFGLMGKIVTDKQLGIVVDEYKKDDLYDKITFLLQNNEPIGDKNQMQAYAEINNEKHYAHTILTDIERIALQA